MTDDPTKISIKSLENGNDFLAYSKHNSILDLDMWYIYDKNGGYVESLSEMTMWKVYERIYAEKTE